MKLRTKVILCILVIWSIMCLLTYINSKWILDHDYLKIENQLAEDNMYRLKEAVIELNGVVENVGASWSPWTDAYEFALNRNKKFFERELGLATIAASDLDVVLIFNEKGQPVFLQALNEARTQTIPLPSELVEALKPQGSLWKFIEHPAPEKKMSGFFLTSHEILFIAIYPILKSDGSGPAGGSFVLARYLDKDAVEQIRAITHQDVHFFSLSTVLKDKKLNTLYETLKEGKEGLDIVRNKKTLTEYAFIKDFEGKPIGLVSVKMSRGVYLTGFETIQYFDIAFTILGLFFVLLLFYLLKKWVIERLEKINHQLIAVGATQNFSLRFPETGGDELSYLGAASNKMLFAIRQYDEQQKGLLLKIRHELSRVKSFSEKLKSTEILLKNIINSMPSMLFLVNQEGQIVDINLMTEQKLNIHIHQVRGRDLFEILPYLKPYQNQLSKTIKQKAPSRIYKICNIQADGEVHYYNILIFPLFKSWDRLEVSIDDISEQIKLEEVLSQNEKLMSMGILTAGVAHEINNPVNFIYSSVVPLSRDLDEILALLDQYEKLRSSENVSKQWDEIKQHQENMDLDVLINEVKDLLAGIEDGTQRTLGIIKSLSAFSKPEEDAIQKADLEQLIDSTLTILHHHYKNRIHIIKEYGGIPLVDGYPGKLSQAFMNILSNAMDAIPDQGEITIKTQQIDANRIAIKIKDNGMGISQENLNKIFDPFFTTKEVGKGTGLGLSVTQEIIRKHQGSIKVISEERKGTEVNIILLISIS